MLDAITAAGSEDLVAECGVHRFVLTAEKSYFVDSTMNDVIDGTFRVFGKVTRVVPGAVRRRPPRHRATGRQERGASWTVN